MLEKLNETIFDSLVRLRNLDLSNNQIYVLNSAVFSKLKGIYQLNLSKNQLLNIDARVFTLMVNVCFLDVSYNKIEAIDKSAFMDLRELLSVYLFNNPISVAQPKYVKSLCWTNPLCFIYV
jgi:slit protein 2